VILAGGAFGARPARISVRPPVRGRGRVRATPAMKYRPAAVRFLTGRHRDATHLEGSWRMGRAPTAPPRDLGTGSRGRGTAA